MGGSNHRILSSTAMGCGGSVGRANALKLEELRLAEKDLREEQRRLEDREVRFATERERFALQLRSSEAACAAHEANARRSVDDLRAEFQAQLLEQGEALARQEETLRASHNADLEAALDQQNAILRQALADRVEDARRQAETEKRHVEVAHDERIRTQSETAEAETATLRDGALSTRLETRALLEEVIPLRQENEEVAQALSEAQERLREARAHSGNCADRESSLEARLLDAQRKHSQSEQSYADLERHLRLRMSDTHAELQVRTEELHQRNNALQERDRELSDVNGQLADLQGLFDEVNRQLQTECGRVEKLQGTVTLCAKQSRELEKVQGMLEDSHQMLAQVRDALGQERSERSRSAALLEHEQQRTRLLLDVLKHFKEKLQGLTPQMLLGRQGCIDTKTIARAGKLDLADMAAWQAMPLATPTNEAIAQTSGGVPQAQAPTEQDPSLAGVGHGGSPLGRVPLDPRANDNQHTAIIGSPRGICGTRDAALSLAPLETNRPNSVKIGDRAKTFAAGLQPVAQAASYTHLHIH